MIAIHTILNFIRGYLTIMFCGVDKIRFINLCKNNHLNIWNVRNVNDDISFNCSVNSFFAMRKIKRKCNGKLKITKRNGLPFYIRKYRKHLFFAIGIVMFFVLSKIISLFVWNISFEGNYSYTDVELMNFLKKHDIENGIAKSEIDCENIEYLLRTTYNDITWVSAEIKGTRIIIHIKENFDTHIAKAEDKPYNIISDTSGTVESIITRSGTPLVKKGDVVEAGQMMVSGVLELYNDSGDIINYHLVNADSDIYLRVTEEYCDEIELEYDKKIYTGETNNVLQLNFMGKSLYLSGIQKKFKDYEIVNDYYDVSITDNYYLPLGYNKICIKEYNIEKATYSEEEAKAILSQRLDNYINKLNEKDVQILENNVTIGIENNKCVARGNFVLVRKTGEIEYIDESSLPKITTEKEEEST